MEKIIHSKTLVFGLPLFIFLFDVVLTISSRQLIEVTSPWMHLAGGFSMGLLFLHFWEENLRLPDSGKNFLFFMITIMAFATLMGVLWEFSEFFFTLATGFVTQPSVDDTIADLFLDLLGGLLVSLFYSSKVKLYKEFPLSR